MKWLKEIIHIHHSMDWVKTKLKEEIELIKDCIDYIKALERKFNELEVEVDKLKNECVKDDCK